MRKQDYREGWRGELRHSISTEIIFSDKILLTKDLNISGFYVESSDFSFDLNEEIKLTFQKNDALLFVAGVVRIDPNGIGFAFRIFSKEKFNFLKDIITGKGT